MDVQYSWKAVFKALKVRIINGLQTEWIWKKFILIFNTEFKLSIKSETNLEIVNYLAVSGIHEPYNKHNNNPININIISNYPLKIIKSLPENIQKRIYKPLIYNINSNHPPKTIKNLPKNIQKRISKHAIKQYQNLQQF